MALVINTSEGSASLRRVPIWLVGSNGTAPATSEAGGQPQINWIPRGAATVNTAATLSLVSANAGEYYVELSASEVSCPGPAAIHYRSASAIPNSTYFQLVKYDSYDSTRLGLVALPNAAANASGGLPLKGTTHSDFTARIEGVAYSGATIDGVTRVNSSVTIANALYSSVTVRLDPVSYSGATVGVGNIAAGSYSGVTVETSNVAQSARSLIADDLLLRSLAGGAPASGGRSVQNALRFLRNRWLIDGSIMTIYTEDDATSAWTASVSTTADVSVTGSDPGGP